MARQHRSSPGVRRPLSAGSVRTREEHADGDWLVATWTARSEERNYTCPICRGRLAASTAHLVVWPAAGGVADRRHVHTSCWRRRARQRDPVRW